MRLYIIRHGETPWNRSMQLQGQTDIPLNENGRSLAKVTARALHEIPFDLCYTSPLIRAAETARLVLGERMIPVMIEERIREIGFGIAEGKRVRNERKDIIDPVFEDFFHHPERYQPPKNGESLRELLDRTGQFLKDLEEDRQLYDKTILISTHGAASRALLANIKGRKSPEDFWDAGVPKNCAVTIVDHKNIEETGPEWVIVEQDKVFYEDK